ncbi:MAG: hypothetical protein JWN14_1098, partial [Chthonomonadales bacterium]|nr:hypothetical protein [Chthonomonadales bacterium]
WYSTLVDYLVDRDSTGEPIPRHLSAIDPTMLGIARIPISQEYFERQKRDNVDPPRHHSTWGEWYLAIEKGTENRTLAIDLINNLMTDRRIIERALGGAGLPPVEDFYKFYGNTKCPFTDLTFAEVRSYFFTDALSRTRIDDYPTFAKILHGVCSAIVTTPMDRERVRSLIAVAFKAFKG